MMDRLERRFRRDYTVGVFLVLLAVTVCAAAVWFVLQVRQLDMAAHAALRQYVKNAEREPPISSAAQVTGLVAGTSHPGWIFAVATGSTRYIVRWPPGTVTSMSRSGAPPTYPNVIRGLSSLAGLEDVRFIVKDAELRILPREELASIVEATFLAIVGFAILDAFAAIFISKGLAENRLRPLRALHAALTEMAETRGDVAHTVSESLNDSLGGVIRAYNLAIDAANAARSERDAAEARTHQFIADVGHQLRTPLTVLSGFVGILRRGQLRHPDDGPKLLEKMDRQIAIMRKLVERMMLLESWQRADTPASEQTDIAEFVGSIVEPMAVAHPDRAVEIHALASATVRVDPSELTYAITNIVANALKYAPESRITVETSVDDANVFVVIADEGPGILPDELPHIFDRFYRGSRRDVPGSGLGLAIAKTAVERSGGMLMVKSEPDKGTAFTIMLPRIVANVEREPAAI